MNAASCREDLIMGLLDDVLGSSVPKVVLNNDESIPSGAQAASDQSAWMPPPDEEPPAAGTQQSGAERTDRR